MAYTWADFQLDYIKQHFPRLTLAEQAEALRNVPVKTRIAGIQVERLLALFTEDQLRQHLDKLSSAKPQKKKSKKKK